MLKLPSRWRNLTDARRAVSSHLRGSHPLRLHSFLLFLFTVVCAFLAAKISYIFGLTALAPRYLLTCSVGYGAFLCGVYIWLRHVNVDTENVSEIAFPSSDYDAGGNIGVGDGIEVVGEAFTAGEGCLFVFVIAIAVTVAAWAIFVLGAEILIDIALEALLAGSLVGALKIGHEPNWFLRLLI